MRTGHTKEERCAKLLRKGVDVTRLELANVPPARVARLVNMPVTIEWRGAGIVCAPLGQLSRHFRPHVVSETCNPESSILALRTGHPSKAVAPQSSTRRRYGLVTKYAPVNGSAPFKVRPGARCVGRAKTTTKAGEH